MRHHLTDRCDNHSIISDAQHGFRQKHSIQSNLTELHDFLVYNINLDNNIDVITIDLQFGSHSHGNPTGEMGVPHFPFSCTSLLLILHDKLIIAQTISISQYGIIDT